MEQLAQVPLPTIDSCAEDQVELVDDVPNEDEDSVVRVGTFNSVADGIGKSADGTYFKHDIESGEEVPYRPTAEEIRWIELAERMLFWLQVRRYAPVAAGVLFTLAVIATFIR